MTTKGKVLRCPTCRMIVTREEENFPFCSDRCKAIDLGKWASGGYRISSPVLDPEVLEGLGGLERPHGEHDEED